MTPSANTSANAALEPIKMTTILENLGQLKRTLEVEIPVDEIRGTYNMVLNRVKNSQVRGFRPGKFPKGWIEKRFQEMMQSVALDNLIPEYSNKAFDEKNIDLATQPQLEKLDFAVKQPLKFKLSFEVKPELNPPDYAKLNLKKQEFAIEDKDINERIDRHRKMKGEKVSKTSSNKVEQGDVVKISYLRAEEGQAMDRKEPFETEFEMGSDKHLNFQNAIKDMSVGQTKAFSDTVKENHGDHSHDLKVDYEVKVEALLTQQLAPLDEAFFSNFKDITNEQGLKDHFRKVLEREKTMKYRQDYHEELSKQLLTQYPVIELPQSLIDKEEAHFEEQHKDMKKTMPSEEYEKTKVNVLNEFKERLKARYIIGTIIKKEDVKSDVELVNQQYSFSAYRFGQNPMEFINTQHGQMLYAMINKQVQEEAALDFVVKKLLGEDTLAIAQ